MNDYKNFCEYVTKPKPTSAMIVIKSLLIMMYALFGMLYLWFFCLNLRSLAMLILFPFLMFAMIRVTWRLVQIEYEFAVEAGELKVAVILGGAARRTKCRVQISDMSLIAPEATANVKVDDFTECRRYADEGSENAYLCVFPDKAAGKKRAIVIETNEEMRRILRLGNPSVFRK